MVPSQSLSLDQVPGAVPVEGLPALEWRAPVVVRALPGVDPGPEAAVQVPGVGVGKDGAVALGEEVGDPVVQAGAPELDDVVFHREISAMDLLVHD